MDDVKRYAEREDRGSASSDYSAEERREKAGMNDPAYERGKQSVADVDLDFGSNLIDDATEPMADNVNSSDTFAGAGDDRGNTSAIGPSDADIRPEPRS